jgi:hypothetical protein
MPRTAKSTISRFFARNADRTTLRIPSQLAPLPEAEGVNPTVNDAKRAHKFKVGQSVSLQSTIFNRDAGRGAYKVTRQLPERDGELEYQVKRPGEPHERVVMERGWPIIASSRARTLAARRLRPRLLDASSQRLVNLNRSDRRSCRAATLC